MRKIGAVVGAFFGGPNGAQLGYAIGSTVGMAVHRPEAMIEVTCIGDSSRRFVPGPKETDYERNARMMREQERLALGLSTVNEGRWAILEAGLDPRSPPAEKCGSCGSSDYRLHAGSWRCSYCRSLA
jgi:hypothetical protein